MLKLQELDIFSFKKLSTLLKKRLFTAEAIFISVIRRPRNKSFFTSISDLTEFDLETFERNFPGGILLVQIVVRRRSFLKTTAGNAQVDSVEQW